MANESTSSQGGSRSNAWLDNLFFNHLEGLAHQALIFLGRMPHPQTGQTLFDPELAREMVDTIEAIAIRAEQSFSPAEKSGVDRLLDQLHMQYVQVAGGSPRRGPEAAATPAEPADAAGNAAGEPLAPGAGDQPGAAAADGTDPSRKVMFHKSYG